MKRLQESILLFLLRKITENLPILTRFYGKSQSSQKKTLFLRIYPKKRENLFAYFLFRR